MKAPPYDAHVIAKWFVTWANEAIDEGLLSNLKLQKLLYYAQGYHLGVHGRPLFSNKIQAWAHGPVVPGVYHRYKEFGNSPIPAPAEEEFDWADVDRKTSQFLVKIWNTVGKFSAWKLRNMTHQEQPWRDAFDGNLHVEITQQAIEGHFRELLNKRGQEQ